MSEAPRGRDNVRAALIAAGTKLFASRGLKNVSVRDLAKEAGVNHGLVHRHFGSKEGLLQAVLTHLADQVEQELGPETPDERLSDLLKRAAQGTGQGAHWRILASVMLEGGAPNDLQHRYPVIRRVLAAARREENGASSPEALTAMWSSTVLGMVLFEPFLQVAIGLDSERWREVKREVLKTALGAIEPVR